MAARGAAAAATAAILSYAGLACGFDDTLTRRGFIKAGDSLCSEAIGQTDELRRAGQGTDPASREATIDALGGGYSSVATGLRNLDLADSDTAMRDEMVARYRQAGAQIEALAGDAAAGDAEALGELTGLRNELLQFARTLRAYGFAVCGGGAPT